MRRIGLRAAAAGVMLAAGVAMASDDAGVSVRGGLLGLSAPDFGSVAGAGLGYDSNPNIPGVTAPPVPETKPEGGAAAGGVPAQPDAAGPDPNENAAVEGQEGPEEPPKPSILRLIVSDWKGELKFGFELASGNSDRTRFRGGFDINKQYWGHRTRIATEYFVANNNRGESENRWVSRFRQDWSTGGTKWNSVFVQVDGDADRFQDYDYRLAISTGPNYQWIKNDKTNVRLNLAASVRREFGARDEDFVPEGAIFLIGQHRFTDTQLMRFRVEYRPEIEQPSRYRINARANYDIDIAPDKGLVLRLAAQNRYDARPSRRPERNDFDMSVYLIWKF